MWRAARPAAATAWRTLPAAHCISASDAKLAAVWDYQKSPLYSEAALAAFVAPIAALAQHGTPFELRRMTPTIEDAAPGREPAPEAKVVPEIYRRQPVFYRTDEAPGTIIIDTPRRFLYLVQANNTALRYG